MRKRRCSSCIAVAVVGGSGGGRRYRIIIRSLAIPTRRRRITRFNPNPDPLLIKPNKPITAINMLVYTRPWLRTRARPSLWILQWPAAATINWVKQI